MKNDFKIVGDTTIIYLNRRDGSKLECLIDTEDFDKVNSIKGSWYFETVNNRSRIKASDGSGVMCDMLIEHIKGMVDYKDGNPLNHKKVNLEVRQRRSSEQWRKFLIKQHFVLNE